MLRYLAIITLLFSQLISIHCEEQVENFVNATFVPQKSYEKPAFGIRIVGGEPAANHQFPWQVSITSCSSTSCSVCGGSLIGKTNR